MKQVKRLLVAALLAGMFGTTIFATASLANGPIMIGPVRAPITVPKVTVTPVVTPAQVQTKLLHVYREVRTFWLSRALVR